MSRLITKKMADDAHKLLKAYHIQQITHNRKNGLCTICGKPIGHIPTENEVCWCKECVDKCFDNSEDEDGRPIY